VSTSSHQPGPTDSRRHSIAESLALIDLIRRLAANRSLPAIETLGRIRDALCAHDEEVSS